MPPTTTGTSSRPASPQPVSTSGTTDRCEPDSIDSPTTSTSSSTAAADDLRRRQPDARVDDLEAGVAGAHRDLLGAVGVTVQAGLADQELQRPAELLAQCRAPAPHLAASPRAPPPLAPPRHPGRRPVLAEHLAQRAGPLADGHAGPGAVQRGRHQVLVGLGRVAQRGQRRRRPRSASRAARQARTRFDRPPPRPPGRRSGCRRPRGPRQRVRLGLGELVDPDDDVLAGLDPPAALRQRRRPAPTSGSRTRRRRPRRPCPARVSISARAPASISARPWPRRPSSPRRGPRTRAGRTRRPGPAACAATTADPTAAAGRAPRSRPAAARRAPARPCDSVTRQHLEQDPVDVVLRLRLGQAERVDLHAVAEAALLGVRSRRSARR